jgi:hypothetical protein
LLLRRFKSSLSHHNILSRLPKSTRKRYMFPEIRCKRTLWEPSSHDSKRAAIILPVALNPHILWNAGEKHI